MRPRPFDYYVASNLSEALELLRTKEDAKILAGGQSLIAVMRLRLVSPKTIIDIGRINELSYVREESNAVRIGALTTHHTIENDAIIRRNFPLITDATNVIADQQVRNRGTIGGSLAHADPSADLPVALQALQANVTLMGSNRTRTLTCSEFTTGYFLTALQPDEIMLEISIPKPDPRSGGAYMKLSRRHGDFAIVSAAAVVTLDVAGACTDLRIVLGGVGERPCEANLTERLLIGQPFTDEAVERAAEKAAEGLNPPSDVQASSEYRLHMSRVIAKRAIVAAGNRAKRAAA